MPPHLAPQLPLQLEYHLHTRALPRPLIAHSSAHACTLPSQGLSLKMQLLRLLSHILSLSLMHILVTPLSISVQASTDTAPNVACIQVNAACRQQPLHMQELTQ